MRNDGRWTWLAVAALAALFAFRCYRTCFVFNDTIDEAIHIASGLELWRSEERRVGKECRL